MTNNETVIGDEGLTVLSLPIKGTQPIADLVFIHGLQGHPEKTWTYSNKKNKAKCFWPRDLLNRDFPNVRVLMYGYDSNLANTFKKLHKPINQAGIWNHSEDFLLELGRERQDAPKRPLIFLAHSLGGVILKDTLCGAQNSTDETENAIVSSTHAVIFFGTPHQGSDLAPIGLVVERAVGMLFTTNSKLVSDLIPNGQVLEKIRKDFIRLLRKNEIKVHSFQESKGLYGIKIPGLSFLSQKVVENSSSTVGITDETTEHINANHREMCRFHGETDPGYRKVKGVISKYLKEVKQPIAKEHERMFKECLRSLYSPAMNQRRHCIIEPESHTFEWIFAEKIFKETGTGFTDWLSGDNSLFWIKGRPTAGKSTLLKYVCEHETTVNILKSRWDANTVVASFFFYDQASSPEWRSFDGLLRSLLFQLLSKVPQLFKHISGIYQDGCAMGEISWNPKELRKAFIAIGRQEEVEGCTCLFIDALDEYGGDCKEIVRNMENLLRWFARGSYKLKICASSRPLIELETMLPVKFPQLAKIDIHEWTSGDIKIIVSNWIGEAKRELPLLCEEIVSMAKGSFKWVNLVLQTLQTLLFNFGTEEQLLDQLHSLPRDLDLFYSHLLENIPKGIHYRLRTVMQLMFCNANRFQSLTLAEYGLAVALQENGIVQDEQLPLSPSDDLRRCRELKRTLDTYLSAFVEVNQEERNVDPPEWSFQPLTADEYQFTLSSLRFSHKTAKEFMLNRIKSDFFETDKPVDNILTGHIHLCRLYTQLAYAKHGMYYLLRDRFSLDKSNTDFNHFDTELLIFWSLHAREAEYLQHAALLGEEPDCHDIRDSQTFTTKNKYRLWPQPPYRRAVKDLPLKHVFDEKRKRRVDDFQRAMCASMGKSWVSMWAEHFFMSPFGEELPVPKSLLDFALINGLFLYARDFLQSNPSYPRNHQDPPLLFWTIASCKFIDDTTVMDLWRDEAERCHMFAQYLLENGADPNVVFTIPFRQEAPDDPLVLDRKLRSGHAEVTLLHFALGVIISITDEWESEMRIAMLELICILTEAGATTGNTLYKNYWKQRLEPEERTAFQYLFFPPTYPKTLQSDDDAESELYKLPDEGPLLERTRQTLLDHGADPYGSDSNGK